MKNKNYGFEYYISYKRIKEYRAKPVSLKLAWLFQGNLLRKSYPARIIKLQDKFRNTYI